MNIIYLGSFPPVFLVRKSHGKIDSLYRDSHTLIKGLRDIENIKLKVITSPDIVSYPKGPLYIKREYDVSEDVTLISSLNLSLLKQLWTIIGMSIEAGKYIRQSKEKVFVVIPYIVFRHVLTLRILKLLYPRKVVQGCIVPDIFFPSNKIHKVINSITEKMAKKFDAFVLYTKKMADHLCVEEGRYEVIEGFREVLVRKPKVCEDFVVVYAGSLHIRYGVCRLLEAMSIINETDIKLHLYGAGSAEQKIHEACDRDKRILYFGRVSNEEATNAIYSASALINPRNSSDGEYTEYSFPSKDIEYMSTGIPVLLCKLPGMPVEYYGHFIDIGDATPKNIANAILSVKNMTQEERDSIGLDSRQFILERMDVYNQAQRIVKLFKRVVK